MCQLSLTEQGAEIGLWSNPGTEKRLLAILHGAFERLLDAGEREIVRRGSLQWGWSRARKALLVRYGGRQPAPSAFLKLHTARDTMTVFQTAFADWDYGGRERVLDTLDASQLFPATRTYEATLAAQ